MSNKSILQSNNEALSANNLDLQSLIDQANALPNADGLEQEDAFITKAISGSYFNDRVTTVGGGVFAGCKVTAVNFPACTTIDCASTPGNYPPIGAFQYCNKLTTVSFPACTRVGSNAFYNCYNLTTANFPVCTTIEKGAFQYCDNLTTVSFPVCTDIGICAFEDCDNLTTVSFPVCTRIRQSAFYDCINLTTVSFPACTDIGQYAFCSCNKLTTVSFPVGTNIRSGVFKSCYNLKSLYLTGSNLCTLAHSNAFSSTPIGGYSASAGTYGSIYVPASLLTSYQTATNWTYFSSRFVGV